MVESEQQKRMREFIAQGNESIRRAEQEYMRGVRADAQLSEDDSEGGACGRIRRGGFRSRGLVPKLTIVSETMDLSLYTLCTALLSCPSPA